MLHFLSINVMIILIKRCRRLCSSKGIKMNSQKKSFHKAAFDKIPPEKRERIMRVAREEFANNGFENTSIQQIAKKADISVGSVYKYFENKEELFTMIVQDGLSELEEMLLKLSASSEDIVLKAEKIIREIISSSRKHPELIKLYCALTTSTNPGFLNDLSQQIEALSAKTYTIAISEAQKIGDVRDDVDPAFFAFLLDNLFMMLQFSNSCDYYKKRFAIYTGREVEDSDEIIVEQTLKFLKAAFNFK